MDPVRVALIGTGWWATTVHIPALANRDDATLVALCDRDPERLAAAGASGAPAYTDAGRMLERERPDAVIVATTHASHFVLAAASLDAGAHVLVEKPLTLTAADARTLLTKADAASRQLLTGYPYCLTTLAEQARAAVAGLGPVQFVQTLFNSNHRDLLAGDDGSGSGRRYPVHGPGAVYSQPEHSGGGHGHLQLTHAAGLLAYLTALRPKRVQARMAHHGLPVDLVDALLIEFEGGALGLLGGTSNGHLRRLDLSIGCADGSLSVDFVSGTGAVRAASGRSAALGPETDIYPAAAPIDELLAVARGAAPRIPAEVGWRAVEILDAAYRSAADDGRPVTIETLYKGPDSA